MTAGNRAQPSGPVENSVVDIARAIARQLAREDYARMQRAKSEPSETTPADTPARP